MSRQSLGGISGSNPSGHAPFGVDGASRYDPGRKRYPALITCTTRKPPVPRGHRQWLELSKA